MTSSPNMVDIILANEELNSSERICVMEKKLQQQNDEITCLKSALADCIRRLQLVEEKQQQLHLQTTTTISPQQSKLHSSSRTSISSTSSKTNSSIQEKQRSSLNTSSLKALNTSSRVLRKQVRTKS